MDLVTEQHSEAKTSEHQYFVVVVVVVVESVDFIMEAEQRTFLREHFKVLADNLDIDLMVPYLYCQGVLTTYDVELFNFSGWESQKMKAIDLCHLIPRRGPEAFHKFSLAISVLQPELFKLLCEDGATTMGRELIALEQRFLVELEKANQEADVTSQDTTIEFPTIQNKDKPLQNPETPGVCPENTGMEGLSDTGIDVCGAGFDQTERGGATHNTEVLDRVERIDQPRLSLSPKREKLSPTTPSNPDDRGAEVPNNAMELTHKAVVQIGGGNKSLKIRRGDIGPDQIRRDPRLERGEQSNTEHDNRCFSPKTVYPLSLRKYVSPGVNSDGSKYVRIKTVRSQGQRIRVAITLDNEQWGVLAEFMDIIFVVQNQVAKEREISLCIHLGGGVFVLVCPTYGNVDIRKYRPQDANQLAIPTVEGISLSPREWRNLLMHKDGINKNHFEAEGSENANCWLAGRHTEFLGPLKCPDCPYVGKRGNWSVRYNQLK